MANKYEKQTRGISKSAGSFDKEEVVKSKWKRLGEWSTRPKNACNTLVVMAFLCYLGAMIGASIYLVPIAWMLYRYFLRQPERAPLKIPMQEKILDLNNSIRASGFRKKAKVSSSWEKASMLITRVKRYG